MTGSVAIDVVLGLVFVFLLYSLLASILFEAISDVFRIRNRNLEQYLFMMLTDGPKLTLMEWCFPSWKRAKNNLADLFPEFSFDPANDQETEYSEVWASYMEPATFSKVIVDILVDNRTGEADRERIELSLETGKVVPEDCDKVNELLEIDPKTLKHLKRLFERSNTDILKFRLELEEWFEFTMDRCASNFKQITQMSLFFIGLFLAMAFNVDSVKIGQDLAENSEARSQMVAMAAQINANANVVGDVAKMASDQMTSANEVLGLGYDRGCDGGWAEFFSQFWSSAFFGWVISAFAISLGAPFWFDLLKKLMKIRSTIPQSGSEDKKKSNRQDVPPTMRVG